VQSKLLGQIGSSKYQWLQNLIRDNPNQVYVYCDTDVSSSGINHPDILSGIADRMTRQELCVREAVMWAELNDLPIARDHFLFDPRHINSGDIVFSFASHLLAKPFSSLAPSSDLVAVFSKPDIFKVIHLSHYIFNFEILVKNLHDLGVQMLCYESNLTKSRLFQRYAPQIREVVPIPFAVQDRFSYSKAPFERDRRCVATGGIDHFSLNPSIKEFFFEYSTNSFNPMRGLLYENQEMLTPYLTVNMSRYKDNLKETQNYAITLESWCDTLRGTSSALKALKRDPSYYGTSFVDLFNSYQLSYVSEELTHAPALGFFESMACGAIPIGIDNFIYNDIGLQPERHYLPFDGSLGGLLGTIQMIWKNTQYIEHIVGENLAFVQQYLRQDKVASRFLDEVLVRYSAWRDHGQPTSGISEVHP